MEKICETMKRVHWSLTGVLALAVVAVMLVPNSASAHCAGKHTGSHPHCTGGGNDDPVDRIAGCVTFAAGNAIVGDGGTYCDGVPTQNAVGGLDSMQVAMDCQFDQFNLYPGGGSRHVSLTLDTAIPTGISSCKGVSLPVFFQDTVSFLGGAPACDSGFGWGFNQLLRTSAGAINVCDLNLVAGNESVDVSMRFQNNLHHRKDCKGGANKCGTSLEGIELNYDGGSGSDLVTVTCTGTEAADPASQCNTWTISSGNGELTHDEGSGDGLVDGSFHATFTTLP